MNPSDLKISVQALDEQLHTEQQKEKELGYGFLTP